MKITDIFIQRPVLATVVSLMILVLGIGSIGLLPIRQFPFTENAIITVTTDFIGAAPETVTSFITTPLENSIAQASGIDYMTSSSTQNTSTIVANLKLDYDSNAALSDINSKINAVLNELPKQSQQPSMAITIGQTIDSLYIGFYSDILPHNKVTDYLIRVVQPQLQAINGVQDAGILGERQFALRAWLDPVKLSAFGVTANDVKNALANNDFISSVGRTDGNMITINLDATTGLQSVDEFRKLIIKAENGAIVRLGDLGTVTLGAENYNSAVFMDNKDAVYISIQVTPTANLLSVIANVKKVFKNIQSQLPQGLSANIVYDTTQYVHASIKEVLRSLIEAMLIVTLVIFLFLGSVRSVMIPSITIPLSLIGAFFIMLLFHFSINLLTLLALVLAIGLVVDDAIIIVENVERHIEEGLSPIDAAIAGARELAYPIIAITVVLISVYLPIGFMGGLTGALFTEFAFSLAGAVTISAIIALTLSPMMCSKLLKPKHGNVKTNKLSTFFYTHFHRLECAYNKALHHLLDVLPVVALFALLIFTSIYFLFSTSKEELAPQEDQGVLISQLTTAPNAALTQTSLYSTQMSKAFFTFPETEHTFQIDGNSGFNSGLVGANLKPWDQRKRTAMELEPIAQRALNNISGAKGAVFQPAPLPGGGIGLPTQFVIQTAAPFNQLNNIAQAVIKEAQKTGEFSYLDSDLKIDKQQITIDLNRDKISEMGLNMSDIGNVLSASLSEDYINYFGLKGRSYQVIPEVNRADRINFDQILNYYIKTANNDMVPLSTVVKFKSSVVPEEINHFQQLNSATISAILAPGVTEGQALNTLNQIAKRALPEGYNVNYAGQSRQYIQEGSALYYAILFALIMIFLALAALFESFRDPLIVLISVPMSICGALIFISMGVGGASLNIYTEVGLVTLIGLISKHGILIVQFANDLQLEGKSKREAIEAAAAIRLRPILMTTAAMVLGVVPLITASGAGAVSRYNIGLVIATGLSIGTLFTLFVVPALYLFLAKPLTKNALMP